MAPGSVAPSAEDEFKFSMSVICMKEDFEGSVQCEVPGVPAPVLGAFRAGGRRVRSKLSVRAMLVLPCCITRLLKTKLLVCDMLTGCAAHKHCVGLFRILEH